MDNKLDLIKKEIVWVDKWTRGLISKIEEKDWELVEELGTSIYWQIGHIAASKYFHAIQSVLEEEDEIIRELKKRVPLENLFKYFFAGSIPSKKFHSGFGIEQLLGFQNEIDQTVIDILDRLEESSLSDKTTINNPVAGNKYKALSFTYKHQMWHNGQIAMIKRIVKNKD